MELGRKTKQWQKEYEKYLCCTQSREAFYQKLFFKNFAIFTGKQLCWSLCFSKYADLQTCNLLNGDPKLLFS